MSLRKKKAQTIEKEVKQEIVKKLETSKRIIPEIPNTIYFYSYNQNLIRMESLDSSFRIDSNLIKAVLNKIKELNLTGIQRFTAIRKKSIIGTDNIPILTPTLILQEEADEELLRIVNKLSRPLVSSNEFDSSDFHSI